ncbi:MULTISPECIES: hypothetical protein [Methylobacter]
MGYAIANPTYALIVMASLLEPIKKRRQHPNATKQNEETIVDIETVFKLVGFLLWPFLLAFLCYLFDIKGFLCCGKKGNPDVD